MKKRMEIFYECPKCKSHDELVGIQLTMCKKHPFVVRHICGRCNTHMVRHVREVK